MEQKAATTPIFQLVGDIYSINSFQVPFSIGSNSLSGLRFGQKLKPIHFCIFYAKNRFFLQPMGDLIVDGLCLYDGTPAIPLEDGSTVEFDGKLHQFKVLDISYLEQQMAQNYIPPSVITQLKAQ